MNNDRFFPKIDAVGVLTKHDRTAWLKGGTNRCIMPSRTPLGKAWRIILLGTPGIGKGTQAELLCERLGTCHLSTSDVFRAAKTCPENELTLAMHNALDFMKRGDLVPDETVLNMVGERLDCLNCSGGFLLDGFPCTVTQAKALEQLLENHNLKLTAVFNYELSIEKMTLRAVSRQPHEETPPEAVRARMEAYQQSVKPLIDFYQQRGLLVRIDAEGTPEEIYRRTRFSALAL